MEKMLEEHNCALLASEMGLGRTFVAIGEWRSSEKFIFTNTDQHCSCGKA
jgi:hypothetical protein